MNENVKAYVKRLHALRNEFESWKLHYIDISNNLIPRQGRFLESESKPNDGRKRHRDIIDNTGGRALRILAAGMQSGLTSPARQWFRLGIPDKDLEKEAEVKQWLDATAEHMRYVFHKSNFYNCIHNIYYELGAFGTAAMGIDKDPDTLIICHPFTAGEYYLASDSQNRINTFYRIYSMTARNILTLYGPSNCSDSVRNMCANGNGDKWVQIAHCIEPNDNFDPAIRDRSTMPFRSLTFEYKNNVETFLKESGFNTFPIMAPRWNVTGTDIYGISPGMEILGDIKMLHKMQKKSLIALDKMVDPPMNAPLTLKNKGTSVIPGGVNYLDQSLGPQTFTPAYQITPDFQSIEYKIEKIQLAIREGFFADLFLMIASSPKNMTATEVLQRHEEKLLMLGPVIERIQPELLDTVIDRTFDIMERSGNIPQPPQQLLGMPLQVEYIGILAQAQKMVGTTSIEQTVGFIGNLAAARPEALDKIDVDEAIDRYAEMTGIPAKIIRPAETVERIRQERQQQIEKQQQQEQLAQLAENARTLSQANTGQNNALTMLTSGIAGNPTQLPGVQ